MLCDSYSGFPPLHRKPPKCFKGRVLAFYRITPCLRSKARWFDWGERSSKYFLNLEKRNYQDKYINKLKKHDSSTITDPTEILNEQQRFFQTLFSSQNPAVENAKYIFLFDDSIVRLNTEQQQHCEGMLTIDECLAALKTFNKNKSPGTDGFTAEFYLGFWDGLGLVMVDSFNYAFTTGNLASSQRQGIIRLIPKKDKDPSYLTNWRPLSLLNVDYKIATKALTLRLKKVLPQVINNAQTGYIGGRFIGQNIRQISDILSFTAEQNIEGIATFIDFEKVSWVKRMIDGKDKAWMAIPSYYLENVGGTFIFKCNYDVDLLDLNGLPEF